MPFFRLALAVLVLALLSLLEPHCFRFALGQFLKLEAWRRGASVQFAGIEGSLYEPVILKDLIAIYESANGPVTRVEIQETKAEFDWRALTSRESGGWFQRLTLDGVTGKIHLPIANPAPATPKRLELSIPRPKGLWLPQPDRAEARGVDFIFESDGDYVRLQRARFVLSKVEPGEIVAGQLTIKQPWLNRSFRDVKGTTKFDGVTTELAAVTLEPGVQIQNLSARLGELARGRLNLEMQIAAFGGQIRMETQTLPRERQLAFEATGSFSQIGVGPLATFLGLSNAAGGTIKDGNFTFRGAPQNPTKAFARVRLTATNFQWDYRQWDSLTLGATLMDQRLQIPELILHQGHNHLKLNGDFTLPTAQQQWWQNEFAFNIEAKIENLTELSALMLPEFKYAAGKATIDGSVRGKDQQFNGQIIVAGSDLTWRNAPVDELHATLKLNGNELQLQNFSIFNEADYFRGRGVVNILGDKQYWGELKASIADLGKYAAILQEPIVPEPLAGGAIIDWSGEGSAKGHSGKFLAKLAKVRSLGTSASLLHPINAELEGTYAPGTMVFERFSLADDDSSFTANVGVGNKALSLKGIEFKHRGVLELQGDALLPLDVWTAWPKVSLSRLLDDQTVGSVALTAQNLDLHAISQLSGLNFPIEGLVNGSVNASGSLGSIQSSGQFALTKGRIPLGWSGVLLADTEAEIALEGQMLKFGKFSAWSPLGAFGSAGEIDFTNLRDPALKLSMQSSQLRVPLFQGSGEVGLVPSELTISFDGQAEGVSSAATFRGAAKVQAAKFDHQTLLLAPARTAETTPLPLHEPPVLAWRASPWASWRFEVSCQNDSEAPAIAGMPALDLQLSGNGAQPVLNGYVQLKDKPLANGLTVSDGTVSWRNNLAYVDVRTTGRLLDQEFAAHFAGLLRSPLVFFEYEAPLTEETLRHAFADPFLTLGEFTSKLPFTLIVPAALIGNVELHHWPVIETPAVPAPETGTTPPTTAGTTL